MSPRVAAGGDGQLEGDGTASTDDPELFRGLSGRDDDLGIGQLHADVVANAPNDNPAVLGHVSVHGTGQVGDLAG